MNDSRIRNRSSVSSVLVRGSLDSLPCDTKTLLKRISKAARWTLAPDRHWSRTDLPGEPLVIRLSTHLRKSELRNFNEEVLDERLTPLCLYPLLNTCAPYVAVHANPRLVQPHTRDTTDLATQPQTAEHIAPYVAVHANPRLVLNHRLLNTLHRMWLCMQIQDWSSLTQETPPT